MYCLTCTYTILILCLYTDPTSYFTLALFPPLVCMTVNFLKISPALVFLESTRSGVYYVRHCACTDALEIIVRRIPA